MGERVVGRPRKKKAKKTGAPGEEELLWQQAHQAFQEQRVAEAEQLCQAVLQKQATHVGALNLLGMIAQQLGQYPAAMEYVKHAIAAAPEEAGLHFNLGNIYMLAGLPKQAVVPYQEAYRLAPRWLEAQHRLGSALADAGEFAAAEELLRGVLGTQPKNVQLLAQLALVLERQNQLEAAEEVLGQAVALEPDNPRVLYPQVLLADRRKRYAEAKEVLEKYLQVVTMPKQKSIGLSHMARLCNHLKEYDAAFDYNTQAQAIQHHMYIAAGGTPEVFTALLQRQKDWFTKEKVAEWAAPAEGAEAPAPVFLVGFPRSGTTLTEQILAAHPALSATQEEGFIPTLAQEVAAEGPYPEVLEGLSEARIQELRALYRARVREKCGEGIVVDKLPLNVVYLGFIYRLFPEAKVIVALRDARDVCLSCFFQYFSPNNAMAHFYTLESTVALYVQVMTLYQHFREVLPWEVHEYRYEALVEDTEGHARALLEFIGVPWDAGVLTYYTEEKNRNVHTPSYEGVMQPVYTTARGKWEPYAAYFAPLKKMLEPVMEALGYGW